MLQILFTINLWLCVLVGLYHMQTRSDNALTYFLGYGIGMSFVSLIEIVGHPDLALELSILAIAVFICAVVFKTFMLIKSNTKKATT